MARECTQAWGPLFPVSRSTDPSMETDEVPATTASVIVPVNMTTIADVDVNDSSASDSTIIPEADPVSDMLDDPGKVPVSTPPVNVSSVSTDLLTMSAALLSTASMSTASTSTVNASSVSSVPLTTSTASTVSVSAPKSQSTRPVSAKTFCTRLSKKFPHADLPDFDQATGTEWDTKAKVYIRQRMKVMFESKAADLRTWTDNDLNVSRLVCEIRCIQNYLVEFVYGIIRSLWNNARKV